MKCILIIGAKDSGKSSTINAICRQLQPSKVWQLVNDNTSFEVISPPEEFKNGTYILEVNGKIILVVAGTPTEQGITITGIIDICISINITIDFALVTMRTRERKRTGDGVKYATRQELVAIGVECIAEEWIENLGANYLQSNEFKARVDKLSVLMKTELEEAVLQD